MQLAQKDYYTRLLIKAKKSINVAQKLFNECDVSGFIDLYEQMSINRQALVIPLFEPLDYFVRNWETVVYEHKAFEENAPELYSERGERVRSKSEKIIADKLYLLGIPYRYEYPLYLTGLGNAHPDFYTLNVRTRKALYWEHFGMMDKPGYVENALYRIECYENTGLFPGRDFIFTYETNQRPINTNIVDKMIHTYLL